MRKVIGWLLILGMLVINACPPDTPLPNVVTGQPVYGPGAPTTRSSSLSTLGGEESIDSFTTHPANRWESDSTGSPDIAISSGQLNITTHSSDWESAEYYRHSKTVDSEIDIRWYLNSSADYSVTANQGDQQVNLLGFNSSTSENMSLAAFPYDGSHYTIRPCLTQGNYYRSWNIDSDYQDFIQMAGHSGADGWDWTEGTTDGWLTHSGGVVTASELGYVNVSRTTADAGFGMKWDAESTADIDPDVFEYLEIKIRANESSISNLNFRFKNSTGAGFDYVIDAGTLSTDWTVYTEDLSQDANWAGADFIRRDIALWAATSSSARFDVDYIRILTTNDDSDLTLYEYEAYYRATCGFNLRNTRLEISLETDSGTDVIETEMGTFDIDDYFAVSVLVWDIWEAEVGQLDYLFGVVAADADLMWLLDYYQAEFTEFNWRIGPSVNIADTWDSVSTFMGMNNFPGITNPEQVNQQFNITVPEFDAASGVLSCTRNNTDLQVAVIFQIFSVEQSSGATTERISIAVVTDGNNPSRAYHADLEVNNSDISSDAAFDMSYLYLLESDANNYTGSLGFTTAYNKVTKRLTFQVAFNDYAGDSKVIGASTGLPTTSSNEFVLAITHWGDSHLDVGEIHTSVSDFTLAFRDLFGDIVKPLPFVGDGGGGDFLGGTLDALLGPLTAILNEIVKLPGLLGDVINSLASLLTELSNILTELGNILTELGNVVSELTDIGTWVDGLEGLLSGIDTLLGNIETAISNLAGEVALALDGALQAIEDAVGDVAAQVWAEFESILDDIALFIQGVAQDLIDLLLTEAWEIIDAAIGEFVAILRAWEVNGIALGDLIDLIDLWTDTFFTTATDTIDFITMLLTTWLSTVLMGLFCLCLLTAALSSGGNAGVFFEKFARLMAININPVGFLLEIKIPLGLILIPNVFFVVLVGFDWATFFAPAFFLAMIWTPPLAQGHPEGQRGNDWDIGEQVDLAQDTVADMLDTIFDFFLNDVMKGAWDELVNILDAGTFLGVDPVLIMLVLTLAVVTKYMTTGRFL
ncbi:MAG: hypothetical protein ACFFCW_13580 [Candidatus Hodarchaeota archaeon]